MKITEAVVRDLHVLVEAGEASDDTRALVEAWLAEHPALAEELRNADGLPVSPATPSLPPLPPDAELRALGRAKRLLTLRVWSMASGFFFTALPLSFVADSDGFRLLFVPSHTGLAMLSLAVGLVSWGVFVRVSRALKPVGF
jgi:anti-sigma factor RsiW